MEIDIKSAYEGGRRNVVDFLKKAPKLRKRDVEDINVLFDSFIFRRRSTGEIWTSCCRRHEKLSESDPIWLEDHIAEPKNGWDTKQARKKNQTACPFCGKKGTVKDLKYCGRRQNLSSEIRVLLLRWDGRALWACAAWCRKDYPTEESLTDVPRAAGGSTYRFGAKAVEWVEASWWSGYLHTGFYRREYDAYAPKKVPEPFGWINTEGKTYFVVGADALEKTAVRYCHIDTCISGLGRSDMLISFLYLAHAYPPKVELLIKAGLSKLVKDYAVYGVKHYTVLDWQAKDTKQAIRVSPAEWREWLSTGDQPDIGALEFYKRQRRLGDRLTVAEAAEAYDGFFRIYRDAEKAAKDRQLLPMKLFRYLDGQNHCNIGAMFRAWEDYTAQGEELGLPMHRSDVLLPKNLGEAHDSVSAAYRNQKKAAEQKAYEERRRQLETKYGFAADGFFIRAPNSGEEIILEGKVLQHCVGGYADRHVAGRTTILFMRRIDKPNIPWLTIEMNGNELKQIHGYRNEGLYTAKGRFAADPREQYRELIDKWLAWLAAGSKRNKDGTPKVPEKRKEKTA